MFIFQKADLAMGSMTINYARESVVDFTKPFMNMGIGILFKVSSQLINLIRARYEYKIFHMILSLKEKYTFN